eukprot:comp19945_c1_seq1/m.24271 comp19945_c1_seq1/g.24271  ORF comp19945_c1_seq1/g.24271 comp19945_c1_seq1/m.24271 type:complete len:243 (-) comp19945_c1_seq1:177-905(-)
MVPTVASTAAAAVTAQPKITHVIFDMDGLLLDTETIYTKVTQEIVAPYGKVFDWSLKVQMMGKKGEEAAKILVDTLQLPITPETYLELREKRQTELFEACSVMPGIARLIKHLHKHNIPIAVATGSNATMFSIKTTRHRDLFALFDHVVTGDDPAVRHGKPAPDLFKTAAERFKVSPSSPSHCLVFEDAPNGVEAAINAGMHVVWIPDDNVDRSLSEDKASQVLSSAEDFKPEDWGLPPFDE